MKNKKFALLILSLKTCLILMIVIFSFHFFSGFVSGWKEGMSDESDSKRKLAFAKETIEVIPLNDTLIYEGNDYAITGISAFQIQERRDTAHSTTYWLLYSISLFIAFPAIFFIVKFLINAFTLLNRFKKFIILEKSNLVLLNKAAINLLISGVLINLFGNIMMLNNLNWFHLEGYKIDRTILFNFSSIVIALILLTASWIIKFAIELKEENDLTI